MEKAQSQPPRSLDKMIEEQIKRWQIDQKKKYKKPIRPVITISRLPGAGAKQIAELLSKDLQIDFFDEGIVEEISVSASVNKRVVESLDEQDRSVLNDWLSALGHDYMSSYEYLEHLTKVVGAIGTHGYALILGRGASFILPQEVSLRVLITAPREKRVNNVSKRFKVSEAAARREVMKTESDRQAFIRKYFHTDLLDPNNYDLVINTVNFETDTAVKIIKEAFNSRHWYNYSVPK
ncbi:MAG: cytidylate kinase-like family protein [Syntrophaceae bacterium]